MKIITVIITVCVVCIGCQSQSGNLTLEDEKLISKMIDISTYPTPPPPPIDSHDTIMPLKMIDSLLRLKLKVAIYPIMENRVEKSIIKDIPEEYRKLIDINLNTRYIDNVNGISSRKGHEIILADTVQLNSSNHFKDFDLLYNFSQIWYNKNKTKAIFELGSSTSGLAGNATVICMKKEKMEWVIDHKIPTTIW